mgnify:CR=1 FL=1
MMKQAYVFPGQGSQYSGMGKNEYDFSPLAKTMYFSADAILGFKITEIMFHGSDEQLRETRVTQPAVFLDSVIKAACIQDFAPDMVAGHSLGELSALVAAKAISFEDGLRLVAIRARKMQECCDKVPGTMAAIIGLPGTEVERICEETPGTVVAANYNSEGQVVISGETVAVKAACEAMKAAGAKRALPLSVSGAFHSPLMESAREALAEAIEAVSVKTPVCPVYQNVSASPETDPERIKANLLAQLTSPVRWTQSVRAMIADGATVFTEIGPGTVLQGLVSRIAKAECVEIIVKGI